MSFKFRQGTIPLLVSIPHNGSSIPLSIQETMTEAGRSSKDTDWFLDRLYDLPETQEASFLIAEQSRYVIDLNRPASDESLYPGQTTTGLIPKTCFDGSPIYQHEPPTESEVQRRIAEVWQPYHQAIRNELDRMVNVHGIAVLMEAHSIASEVPRLFEGRLPEFNFGTNRGESADPALLEVVEKTLASHHDYRYVSNQRFVGGYITRHFGQPAQNQHALQIELSQATYMNEKTLQWDDQKAKHVQVVFQTLFQAVHQWLTPTT